MFYRTPKRGISHNFTSPNRGKGQYRLDCILNRQAELRPVRDVAVRRFDPKDSDQSLGVSYIRLMGRIAPNRRKRYAPIRTPTSIDLQRLLADPKLRKAFRAGITPPTPASVDDMVTALTTAVRTSAMGVAPRAKTKRTPSGWCASKQVQQEINDA